MKWLKYTIFLVMLLPALAQAQYRGSGRPLSRQETLDSLAAKLDTSAVAAGNNVTVDWDGSSLTIASSGGGGGSNWNPADSTLSLDLPYYSDRNVIHLCGIDVYSLVGNFSAGEHGDSMINFLTDNQSIGVVCPSGGASDGIVIPLPDTNWTKTTDGDTIELADWYFCAAVKIDSASIARLPVNGLKFAPGTAGNTYYTSVARANFTVGWNFIKAQLSTFGVSGGAPSWANMDTLWVLTTGTQSSDGDLYFLVDNFQLVRGIDGEPNPYQSEGPDGTWVADWTPEGNGNTWIVDESGVISMMNPETWGSNYLLYNKSLADYEASGIVKASAGPLLWHYKDNNNRFTIYSNEVKLHDSTGTFHTNAFNFSTGDKIFWKFIRKGTSITGSVSHTGNSGDWTSVSTFGYSGLTAPRIYIDPGQRTYSLGASAVAYAAEAGVAQRLKDWHFDYTGGLFKIFMPDSVLWFIPDSVTVNPN